MTLERGLFSRFSVSDSLRNSLRLILSSRASTQPRIVRSARCRILTEPVFNALLTFGDRSEHEFQVFSLVTSGVLSPTMYARPRIRLTLFLTAPTTLFLRFS